MKYTVEKLAQIVAAGVAEAHPSINPATVERHAKTAASAAFRAKGGAARAIAALNNAPASTVKAAGGAAYSSLSAPSRSIIDAARAMTPAPSHVPDASEIQRAIGSPVPLRNLPDHDQVRAIMRASRGKR